MSSQESKTRANERKKTIEASTQGGKRQHQEERVNSNFIPFRISKILNTLLFHVKCSFNYTTILYLLYLYGNSICKLDSMCVYIYIEREGLGLSCTWYNSK